MLEAPCEVDRTDRHARSALRSHAHPDTSRRTVDVDLRVGIALVDHRLLDRGRHPRDAHRLERRAGERTHPAQLGIVLGLTADQHAIDQRLRRHDERQRGATLAGARVDMDIGQHADRPQPPDVLGDRGARQRVTGLGLDKLRERRGQRRAGTRQAHARDRRVAVHGRRAADTGDRGRRRLCGAGRRGIAHGWAMHTPDHRQHDQSPHLRTTLQRACPRATSRPHACEARKRVALDSRCDRVTPW